MADLMCQVFPGVSISAITDINEARVMERLAKNSIDSSNIKFYADADEMMNKEELDCVLIGTRCSLHTSMAIKVLKRDIPLFLEKPVSTNDTDLIALQQASKLSKSPVVVSFPLRVTPLAQLAKEIIESGKIGTVENAIAFNHVPYGGVYYQSWYRDENETQGLFLQKATHDFDCLNYLVGKKPVNICAMSSKQIFKGSKAAGLHCIDCDEYETCLESSHTIKTHGGIVVHGGQCCFSVDTGNEDSGSAIILYEDGMHVTYNQNFFARNKAAARGAKVFGYNGTLEFDWFKDELNVFMHHTPRVESYKVDTEMQSHGGGDEVLAKNFIDILRGKETISVAPIEAGILSALMCLKAKESAQTMTFQKILL